MERAVHSLLLRSDSAGERDSFDGNRTTIKELQVGSAHRCLHRGELSQIHLGLLAFPTGPSRPIYVSQVRDDLASGHMYSIYGKDAGESART